MSYKRISPQPVVEGGTGIQTATSYAPICAGTTATGAFQVADTDLSTSGYVLTSNGSSALPTWQAGGGTPLVQLGQVTLTSTQMKTLLGNRYEIIPAPGSGKIIRTIIGLYYLNYGGNNAFSGGNATFAPYWGTSDIQAMGGVAHNANIIDSTQSRVQTCAQVASGNPVDTNTLATYQNVAINFGIQSTGTNIAGNAANNNTFTVYVYYTILTL